MSKYSKLLFGSLTALGAVFVALFFILFIWLNTWSFEILAVQNSLTLSQFNFLIEFSLIGGTGFLTVGLSGVGRQFVKNRKNLLTVLTVIMVPLLVFSCLISTDYIIRLNGNMYGLPPEKIAFSNASLDSTNPLTVSVNAKSSYSQDICFDTAVIEDSNQTTVASINSDWIEVKENSGQTYSTTKFIYTLPPGADQILTFNFNATLPTGNYTFMLCTDRSGRLFSYNFAIT